VSKDRDSETQARENAAEDQDHSDSESHEQAKSGCFSNSKESKTAEMIELESIADFLMHSDTDCSKFFTAEKFKNCLNSLKEVA
jgi:hypothetical protein